MHNFIESKRAKQKNLNFSYYSPNMLKKFGTMLYEWKDEYNTKSNRINFGYFGYTPTNKLNGIVSKEQAKLLFDSSSYTCPFNKTKHISIVPVWLLTEDPKHYVRLFSDVKETDNDKSLPWYTDMACDPTWQKDGHISSVNYELDSVSKAAIGSGYTGVWWPNDGSFYVSPVAIDLENGDTIVFACLKWYNK